MRILGINGVFHDSAAAVVVDGVIVAAAEEERFTRRKHGKRPVPFSAWELPEYAIGWVMAEAGLNARDLDAVAYSYDPDLAPDHGPGMDPSSEPIRTDFVRRAPRFLHTLMPEFDPVRFRFVRHHVAHAASAGLLHPGGDCAVLVCDGRGEATSMLAGQYLDGQLKVLSEQRLPHSLGLLYEELTEHLGFHRSADEYKVMALASYGRPRFVSALRRHIHTTGAGHFVTEILNWDGYGSRREPSEPFTAEHADLACSVQTVVEEVLLDLAVWLHDVTGADHLAMAGGTALNCVANTRLHADGPFETVWVQPASGDSGTALGAALTLAVEAGDRVRPFPGADLGRGFDDDEIAGGLRAAGIPFERPDDVADECAKILADDGVVAWFQGRAEFGPRALGHRSLLANPGSVGNVERLNNVKGREQFRPVAPMVLASRAHEIFSRGPLPSPYMLFVHDVAPQWRSRLPAVTHVDGTARIQTVDPDLEPRLAHLLDRVDTRTGAPVVVNTSLNTAGRPMVDSVTDVLELFGSAPVDAMALGPYLVRRHV